jgi:hypothetical protein
MNPFEMVVAIILVVTIGKVLQAHFRYRDRGDRRDPAEAIENRQLKGEVQTLKERIAVLERLATDDNSSARLDREIEKLRDRSERNRVDD